MKDPSYALQAAYVPALTASAAVKALIGTPARVYDRVPDEPTYPYVRIGDDQVIPEAYGCTDTWEAHVTVHVWSRAAAPRPEVKAIANALAEVLAPTDAPFTLDGFTVSDWAFTESHTVMEADGATAHGVLTFRYLLVEGEATEPPDPGDFVHSMVFSDARNAFYATGY